MLNVMPPSQRRKMSPICLQCGCNLDSYEHERYARCDDCFARLAERPEALALPDHVTVCASYHPGFAEDLTAWDTFFFGDGAIKQKIRWYPPVHGKDRQSELTANLDDAKVAQLNEVLASIDLASLARFKRWMCVDDAPFVHIFSPRHNLHVSVDQFGLDDDDMPDTAKAGVRQFQVAWELLDSFSPYTMAAHYR